MSNLTGEGDVRRRRDQRRWRLMWVFFAALMVLHHDWWFWTDTRLVLGFLPIGLAYHMLISVLAGGLWGWAAWHAWPAEYDEDEPAASLTEPLKQHG